MIWKAVSGAARQDTFFGFISLINFTYDMNMAIEEILLEE